MTCHAFRERLTSNTPNMTTKLFLAHFQLHVKCKNNRKEQR